ncbi:MAG: PSD1 and planctomycete cytochrome C domain-containing protein [Candidatus Hydrogenedentes bacterium]|nr:PSD1 and planctomycete cytochrome C domain-containing protein [Candidatus Hydrogenedentota bacterium]
MGLSACIAAFSAETAPVDFHAQILPILSKNCMKCHDRPTLKGGLSLESADDAHQGGDSGQAAYKAGKSAESALILRVTSNDPGFRMPSNGEPLATQDIALLAAWIDQGGSWGGESIGPAAAPIGADHWSFQKPVQGALPEVKNAAWARNPIDTFILAKLEELGLAPSAEADRYALLRRASLDLTGLPPAPEEIDAFITDTAPDAYERVIDRLLASPHYGEAQAMRWMDAARYADTNGFEKDRPRSIWPYRDWVIAALNANIPYDQFVIKQLAGDLLPDASVEDNIATGFHRNTMLNEEGGIDVEEYRYEAVVDRTNTTGQVFLGLTFGCAQCHTHKYDPISHDEYFQLYAFLNDTDDVDIEVPDEHIARKREKAQAEIDALIADLPNRFPVAEPQTETAMVVPAIVESSGGATLAVDANGVIAASGSAPETDSYRIEIALTGGPVTGLRIDTSPNPGDAGAGRSSMGNFVITEAWATANFGDADAKPVKFARAESDVAYGGFEAEKAIDDNNATGWAVDAAGVDKAAPHTLTLWLEEPLTFAAPGKVVLTLHQQYGRAHTLSRFKVSTVRQGYPPSDEPDDVRRAKFMEQKFAEWQAEVTPKARKWTVLDPVEFTSEFHSSFRILEDKSILAHGDNPNTDIYTAKFRTDLKNITAIRIEVLPDASLPNNGPGRGVIMSEGGDFLLSEVRGSTAPWLTPDALQDIALQNPTVDYMQAGRTPEETLDGKRDTGWAIKGAAGKPHAIVYQFAEPITHDGGTLLQLVLEQFYVHNHTIGRFRVSATSDPLPVVASGVPADIESILGQAGEAREGARPRAPEDDAKLVAHYLSVAPELADAHKQIADLHNAMPKFVTTQVLEERMAPRVTHVYHRGEFLSPEHSVTAGVLVVLPPVQEGAALNRLTMARWIMSDENPLTARVAVNRLWQTYFGRGIVASAEDFGARGEKPTHPELLDWLAVEFMRRGWDLKEMTRMMVTSATYRQSATVTPELLAADPSNEWLARAPRYRVEAEFVRDIALSASGLLSAKIGGPSVKPPLPDGALSMVYPGEGWTVAEGEDRYRRGMYVYWKRTLPYPAANVFDAPARDVATVTRTRSSTPLQALTLMNDPVFVEAADAFAKRVLAHEGDDAARIRYAFLLCVSRPPDAEELSRIKRFLDEQRAGKVKAADSAELALVVDGVDNVDDVDKAAWTVLCRALLNLDETITKG